MLTFVARMPLIAIGFHWFDLFSAHFRDMQKRGNFKLTNDQDLLSTLISVAGQDARNDGKA
jgi:hypothetical protein